MRSRISRALALAVASFTFVSVAASPVVQAAPKGAEKATNGALVAPGAPMRSYSDYESIPGIPQELDSSFCTQGLPGVLRHPDGTTLNVMVTAGHCISSMGVPPIPNGEVYVPTANGDIRIGTADNYRVEIPKNASYFAGLWEMSQGADWGVVALDDALPTSRISQSEDAYGANRSEGVKITGVRDYPAIGLGEFRFDNAGQPICKDGQTSARSCGVQLFRSKNSVYSYGLNYNFGDSGGLNFDPRTGEAIGVTSESYGPIARAQTLDVALEEGYGIKDGEVNLYFQVAEGTDQHSRQFRTMNGDVQATQEWINRNVETQEMPTMGELYHDEAERAVATVGEYRESIANNISRGDLGRAAQNFNEAAGQIAEHAGNLAFFGVLAGIEENLR